MTICPECGATLTTETCRQQFDLCILKEVELKEVEDPRFYTVHHLIVPAYMLQHDIYSPQAWWEVRKLVGEFLTGLTPAAARKRYKQQSNSHNRSFRIVGNRSQTERDRIAWSVTIADVRIDTPDHYIIDVNRLAQSVLDDTRFLEHEHTATAKGL
jgi:hypothetical protein